MNTDNRLLRVIDETDVLIMKVRSDMTALSALGIEKVLEPLPKGSLLSLKMIIEKILKERE